VGKDHLDCTKVLTEKARELISSAIEAGKYRDREGILEPPFMAPSANPEEYSPVCI
jgi:hypothetical protein